MKTLALQDVQNVSGGLSTVTYYDFDLLIGKEVIGCRIDVVGWDTVTTIEAGPGLFGTTYVITETPIITITPYYQDIILNGLV